MSYDYTQMSEAELTALYDKDDDELSGFLTLWGLQEPEPHEHLLGPQDPY